jgi:DNA-binding MarR family transcriptional regulator
MCVTVDWIKLTLQLIRGGYMNLSVKQARENSFGFLINMLAQKINKVMAVELQSFGLNLGQFVTLMVLAEKEGINQTELGNTIGMPGYATTRNLDALEELKLVQRHPHPKSRRSHMIYLTKKGKALARKLPPLIEKVNSDFLAELEVKDRHQLIELLKKVLNSLDDALLK